MTIIYTIYIDHSPLLWPIWSNMPKRNQISIQSNHQNLSLANLKLYNFTHANQEKFLPHQKPICKLGLKAHPHSNYIHNLTLQ